MKIKNPISETWWIRLHNIETSDVIWIRGSVLKSSNGFKRIAEVLVLHCKKTVIGEIQKNVYRQTFELAENFFNQKLDKIIIGNCLFSNDRANGKIESKGNSIEWDLSFNQNENIPLFSKRIKRLLFIRGDVSSSSSIEMNGKIKIENNIIEINTAAGKIGYFSGFFKNWIWAHCNEFYDQQSNKIELRLNCFSFKPKILGIPTPSYLSACLIRYMDKMYEINTLPDLLKTRSDLSQTTWEFQTEHGPLLFKGKFQSKLKDFSGLSFEDTEGNLRYSYSSHHCNVSLLVYRKGKLESTSHSPGFGTLEFYSANKNPYIPMLS